MTPYSTLLRLTLAGTLAAGVLLPTEAEAQRHGHVHGAVVVGAPYYYAPFYWGFGWGWGWGPYGAWGYPWGPWGYPGPYCCYYDNTGDARLQVKPKETQVFIDGYFVGVADEFDGSLQRLRVEPGEHDLSFYLEGHKTAHEKVLFRREGTLRISHVMEPLGPGETAEKPTPVGPPPGSRQRPRNNQRQYDTEGPPPPPQGGERDSFGTLSIRVQPADAEVYIDGERWDGAGGNRLNVELADGPHRVEIRKEGFRSYTANVRIRKGQTENLNVSLNQ